MQHEEYKDTKHKLQERDNELQKKEAEYQKDAKRLESYKHKLEDRDAAIAEKMRELAEVKETLERNDKTYHDKVQYSPFAQMESKSHPSIPRNENSKGQW
jgi:hypothetical protein